MRSAVRLRDGLGDQLAVTTAGRNFRVFLIITFINGAIVGPFVPFLPVYVQEKLGTSQVFTAGLQTVTLLLGAIFVLFGGAVSDALGPKTSLILGALGTPLAAAVFMTGNHWALVGIAMGRGITQGFGGGGSQTYLVESAPGRRLASATAVYFMGSTLGAAIGSPLAGLVLEVAPFSLLGTIMLATSAPVVLAMLFLLGDVRPPGAARLAMRKVLAGYLSILGRRYVWSLALMQYLRTCFWGAAVLAMPFLIHSITGSKLAVGWFTSVSLICGMVSMFVVGNISDRVGRRRVVLASLTAIGLSSLMLAASVGSVTAMFVSGVVATTAAWTLSGQMTPLAKEVADPGEAGRLVGAILFPHALGMLTGAQIHGLLTENHPALMFVVLAVLLVAAWGFGAYMFRAWEGGS